jgi:hypothetical protein
MCEREEVVDIPDKEIIVFKKGQRAEVGHKAQEEEGFASFAGSGFDTAAGDIIDDDDGKQDEEIGRDKRGVEIAAGDEQEKPASPVWREVIQRCYDKEEKQEGEGVEKHKILFAFSPEDDPERV